MPSEDEKLLCFISISGQNTDSKIAVKDAFQEKQHRYFYNGCGDEEKCLYEKYNPVDLLAGNGTINEWENEM